MQKAFLRIHTESKWDLWNHLWVRSSTELSRCCAQQLVPVTSCLNSGKWTAMGFEKRETLSWEMPQRDGCPWWGSSRPCCGGSRLCQTRRAQPPRAAASSTRWDSREGGREGSGEWDSPPAHHHIHAQQLQPCWAVLALCHAAATRDRQEGSDASLLPWGNKSCFHKYF